MTTLMDFIVAQSSLSIGNTIRDHIENPSSGGTGGTLILSDGLELEVDAMEYELEIETVEYEIEIEEGFDVEVETPEYELEIE